MLAKHAAFIDDQHALPFRALAFVAGDGVTVSERLSGQLGTIAIARAEAWTTQRAGGATGSKGALSNTSARPKPSASKRTFVN
jgi:hypothetical protein